MSDNVRHLNSGIFPSDYLKNNNKFHEPFWKIKKKKIVKKFLSCRGIGKFCRKYFKDGDTKYFLLLNQIFGADFLLPLQVAFRSVPYAEQKLTVYLRAHGFRNVSLTLNPFTISLSLGANFTNREPIADLGITYVRLQNARSYVYTHFARTVYVL